MASAWPEARGSSVMRLDTRFADRMAFEGRLAREALRHPLSCCLSALMLAIGVGYLVGPIDLLRGPTLLGHLDEIGFLVVGVVLARMLLPDSLEQCARSGAHRAASWTDQIAAARDALLSVIVTAAGVPLLRLALGRWPTTMERHAFAAGFVGGERVLPPILRGLHAVPAAKEQLGRAAVLNLIREGALPALPTLGADKEATVGQNGNPLSFWTGPPIAFLHLEKTAGIALSQVLTELFHPLQIDDDPHRAMPPHMRTPFPPHALVAVRRSRLIWGHYDLPALRRADPERLVLTLLREPRSRLLSLYHYWRSVDASLARGAFGNWNVAAAHDHDLLGFLRLEDPLVRNYTDNFYVRRLTGLYRTDDGDPVEADPHEALRRAELALESLAFAGIVERTDASLARLSRVIGAPLPARLPRLNHGSSNARKSAGLFRGIEREPTTAAIEAELDRLTRLDRAIYERAERSFDARAC